MKKSFLLLYVLLCLMTNNLRAQDSLGTRKNQIYIELLGNNFAELNLSSANPGLISINYGRKIISKNNCFIFSLGIGPVPTSVYDPLKKTTVAITNVCFPAGILWRKKYKQNGFWTGLFFTGYIGTIAYMNETTNQGNSHNGSFQISPNLTYQFHSKSRRFFYRFSFTPKFLASNFSDKYGYPNRILLLWGGICIGGGW